MTSLNDNINSHAMPELDTAVVAAANEFAQGDTKAYTKSLERLAVAYQKQGMTKHEAELTAQRRVDALLAAAIDERFEDLFKPEELNATGSARPIQVMSELAARLDFSKPDVAYLASVRLAMIETHYNDFVARTTQETLRTRQPATEIWQGPPWAASPTTQQKIGQVQLNLLYLGGVKFEQIGIDQLGPVAHTLNGLNGAAPVGKFKPTSTYVYLANRMNDFWPGKFATQLGHASTVVDVVTTTFDVWNQVENDRDNPNLTTTKKVFRGVLAIAPGLGGVAGAVAGAEVGSAVGVKVGLALASPSGPGAGGGAFVGGMIGGFVGGIGGGFVGEKAARKAKEEAEKKFFPQDPPAYLKPLETTGPPVITLPYNCTPTSIGTPTPR